ncbi:MAG TPA: TonB-dependent receptor [Alloacidobacterium sp.]|nr:TonB-dependent receptor [Alloacidobacterium sp.]
MRERRLQNQYASLPAFSVSGKRQTQNNKALFLVVLVLCVAILFQPKAFGQAEQGTITGAVRDTSGAVIPGAKIHATNVATNTDSVTLSDSNGYYTIPYLAPGTYNVTAEASGFAVTTVSSVHITVNLSTSVNLTLKIGSVSQNISVKANAIQLETENSELGGTVSRQQIIELPQLGRNPYNLLSLQPGVLPVYSNAGIQAEINGGMANTSNVLLDGATQVNASSGDLAYTPPLESVGELKLITNNYSAEYGMSGGGVVTAASQSGTNTYHGSAYEYVRNTDFNANGWYPNHVGQQRSTYHENNFGFSIGGPLSIPKVYNAKNRTFFFLNLEWDPQSTPSLITGSVPTPAMRTGDFSGLVDQNGNKITIYDPNTTILVPGTANTWTRSPFPGNIIPADRMNNPIVQNVLSYYPLPNTTGVEGIYNNYVITRTRKTSQDTFLARVDQNFGNSNKFFVSVGRHAYTGVTPLVNIAFPQTDTNGNPGGATNTAWTGTISDTWTIKPNLLMEFRGNFVHSFYGTLVPSQGFDVASLGLPQSFVEQTESKVFPQFQIGDESSLGLANSAVDSDAEGSNQGQAHLTWVTGPHTVKAGFEYRFVYFNQFRPLNPAGYFTFGRGYTQGPDPASATSDAGFGFASFLLGAPDGGYTTKDASATSSQKNIDAYVNDDYKVTDNLTLNLGLRYDVLTGWTDRYNKLTWFNPTASDPVTGLPGVVEFADVNGNPRAENDTDWTNFAPRVGFAYKLGDKTAIRGGYGLFWVTNSDGNVAGTGWQVSTNVYTGPPSPAPNTPPAGASLSNPFVAGYLPYPAPASSLVGQGIGAPYRPGTLPNHQDWNLSVQRSLSSGTVLTVAYAGSRGEHIWYNLDRNSAPIGDLSLGSKLTQQVANPFAGELQGQLGAPTVAYSQLLRPFPQYTGVSWYHDPVGDSYYDAFTAQLQHRDDAHGLFLQASYSYSKNINDIPERYAGRGGSIIDPTNLGLSRAVSEYDRTHYVIFNYIYQLPFGHGHQVLGKGIIGNVIGNWQWAGVTTYGSGLPVVITVPNNTNLPGIGAVADRLHDPQLQHGQSPDKWFDTSAYAIPAAYTTGNGNRNEPRLRGPALGNWDMSLNRKQQFGERVSFELRFEAFNAFNNRNLGAPDGSITDGTFGQITSSGQPRNLQIGARLAF